MYAARCAKHPDPLRAATHQTPWTRSCQPLALTHNCAHVAVVAYSLGRSCVISQRRIPGLTWANAARSMTSFWLHHDDDAAYGRVCGKLSRLNSYQDGEVGVPFWLHFPPRRSVSAAQAPFAADTPTQLWIKEYARRPRAGPSDRSGKPDEG